MQWLLSYHIIRVFVDVRIRIKRQLYHGTSDSALCATVNASWSVLVMLRMLHIAVMCIYSSSFTRPLIIGYSLRALFVVVLQEDGCQTHDLLYTTLIVYIQW